MKSKILLCLALVLSGLFCGCVSRVPPDPLPANAEPRYQDKSLSEWISLTEYEESPTDLFRRLDARALPAVLAIGTNALPWLLHWIRSDKPERVQLGINGFNLLGPIAKPAVPMLIRLVNDWPYSTDWSNAIPALAAVRDTNGLSYALRFLLSVARNRRAPAEFRLQAVQSIGERDIGAKGVASVFVVCLKDKDRRVVAAAANGLGDCSAESKQAVPALIACLMSHTNEPEDFMVRNSAVSGLEELNALRKAMSTAVPAFVKTLDDRDYRVASRAATALGQAAVQPDIVVPALVKSLNYPYPDKYGDVRRAAIVALGNYGAAAQSAVPALAKLAHDDPRGYVGGGFAANALKKIIPATEP
jgi:hypothetical protein